MQPGPAPPPGPEAATSNRARSRSLRPLLHLLPYLGRYRGTLTLALGALLIASGLMLSLPVAGRHVIDQGFAAGSSAAVDRYFLIFGALVATFSAFASTRFYLLSWIGERVVADIRAAVYAHVIRMDPAFFEVTRTGEVLSRLTADTTLIQSIAGVGLSMTLRSLLQLPIAMVMLAVTNLKLMGIIVLLIPLAMLPVMLIGRQVRRLSRASQDRIADTSALAGESLNAVQIVQAFTAEPNLTRRFQAAIEASFTTAVVRTRARAVMTFASFVCVLGGITFVLWIGARAVLRGEMSYGELSQFLLYAVLTGTAATTLTEMWGEVQRASGAMERLVELLDAKPQIAAPVEPMAMPAPGSGRIRFEKVGFSYPSRPGQQALDDFTLDIEPGECVAFVGPSGAGKSTVFQLLLRFYDPQRGRILIDGVEVSAAEPREVRARIGLVPQDTVVFGDSARENIRFGRPGASDEEVRAAARAAVAEEFIGELPQGYDTFLGERGTRLSGGQRQRIAIARAILKDPPILLLDEATSALDAENELLVQRALDHLMQDRTTIIIAHRLATVLKAHRIVVMDQGRIIDIGSHEELVGRNALYARLAELQFGAAQAEQETAAAAPRPALAH